MQIYALIAVGLILGSTIFGFNAGKKIERLYWLEMQSEASAELSKAMQRVADLKNKDHEILIGAISERDNEITRLNNDLVNHGRLRIKAAACNAASVPGEAEGSGLPNGEERIELPREVEQGLRVLINELQMEVLNCNTLKDIISQHVEVVN